MAALREAAASQPIQGLKRAFKVGRKSFRRAQDECTDDGLHEWRKQAKYFAGQLEILEPFGPKSFAKSRKRANRLADVLGEDHDLAVLAARILRFSEGLEGAAGAAGASELVSRLLRRRRQLQRRAFRLGSRLFAAPSRHYDL
jgi:CHAD domain-containing protein